MSQKSPMLPVAGTTSFVVTTDDGCLFHCQPYAMEDDTAGLGARWILIDTQCERHVGPAYDADATPEALQRTVSEWWAGRAEA